MSPLKVIGLVALFALGAAVGWLASNWLTDSDRVYVDKDRTFSPVDEETAGELAARFRPWLLFDSHERWRPQSIPSLLSEQDEAGRSMHKFCVRSPRGQTTECDPVGSIEDFEALIEEDSAVGSSTYLDVHGERKPSEFRAPQPCRQADLLDCDESPGSAIYYNVVSSNHRFYIDYWWFMRFNHFELTNCRHGSSGACDEHEGDWEGVTLVTEPDDEQSLDYVVYAAHRDTFRYPIEELKEHEGRPIVYVAYGSHASYAQPCKHRICKQSSKLAGFLKLPETSTDGARPWARNGDECEPNAADSCLLALPRAEPGELVWTTWDGLWGETCGKRCKAKSPQAPASPGLQARFERPWCSLQKGSLVCDSVAPGCNDWLGPLVAVLVCNPEAIAEGLEASEEAPSGGLTLHVNPADEKPRRLSATTRGVVQALGTPLKPGSRVTVGDAGSESEILIRAAQGNQLLEARFEPFEKGGAGRTLKIEVGESSNGPVLHATRDDGGEVRPTEERRKGPREG